MVVGAVTRIKVTVGGRSISVIVPDGGDVEVDLSGGAIDCTPGDGRGQDHGVQYADCSPSARRMYAMIRDCAVGGTCDVEPDRVFRELGLSPVGQGRALAELERLGMIEVLHRRRRDRGKIECYKVRLTDVSTTDGIGEVLKEIASQCGQGAAHVFKALLKLSTIDGTVVCRGMSEIHDAMDPKPSAFPASALDSLAEHGWIELGDSGGVGGVSGSGIVIQICGWNVIGALVDSVGPGDMAGGVPTGEVDGGPRG